MHYLTIKQLISVALIITASSSAAFAGNEKNKASLRAEASPAEAKLSFRELPYLDKAYISVAPEKRKDGIVVGDLVAEGGNKKKIVKLAKEMAQQKHGKYDSLLISRDGKLIFESYFLRGRINLNHGQASATKGHTSLILGRAIQLGYLTMADLDKPIAGFLKDLAPEKFTDGAENITLHKALTMHGGLVINEEQRKALRKPSEALLGQQFAQALFEQSAPITPDTQVYNYGNYNPTLVMQVIDAVTPNGAEAFIKKEFLDKMDITHYKWPNDPHGQPNAGSRARLMSRDMLKLGSLVLNNGKWKGEQLISADYVKKATSPITLPTEDWMPKNYFYGYFFYQTDILIGNKSYNTSFAWGGGGQYVITVQELGLNIAITGHERDKNMMVQVAKYVLPAFVK